MAELPTPIRDPKIKYTQVSKFYFSFHRNKLDTCILHENNYCKGYNSSNIILYVLDFKL